jgi:hypothetical protein
MRPPAGRKAAQQAKRTASLSFFLEVLLPFFGQLKAPSKNIVKASAKELGMNVFRFIEGRKVATVSWVTRTASIR